MFNILPGMGFLKDNIWEGFCIFDIAQMLTPPKSKSPWEAMTRGSTGGWAESLAPGESLGFVGPLLTTAAGAIPYGVGIPLAATMGAAGMTGIGGYPGTTKPIGEQVGGTLLGAGAGAGAGFLGRGVRTGIEAAVSPTGTIGPGLGFGGGASLLTEGGQTIAGQPALNRFTAGFGAGAGLTSLGDLFGGGSKTAALVEGAKGGGGTAGSQGAATMGEFLKSPSTMLAAAGFATAGSIKTPEPPPIGPIMEQYLGPAGYTQVGRKAREELEKGLTLQDPEEYLTDAYFQATERLVNKQYDRSMKDLEQRYAAYGMRHSGQLYTEMGKLEEERAYTISQARFEAMDRRYTLAKQTQYNSMMAALEVDDQVKHDLLYGEIYDVASRYQAQVSDIEALRELAATAGIYGMLGSLGAFQR